MNLLDRISGRLLNFGKNFVLFINGKEPDNKGNINLTAEDFPHNHDGVYLKSLTKRMIEEVLTGNVITHEHTQYVTGVDFDKRIAGIEQRKQYRNIVNDAGWWRIAKISNEFKSYGLFRLSVTTDAGFEEIVLQAGCTNSQVSISQLHKTSGGSVISKIRVVYPQNNAFGNVYLEIQTNGAIGIFDILLTKFLDFGGVVCDWYVSEPYKVIEIPENYAVNELITKDDHIVGKFSGDFFDVYKKDIVDAKIDSLARLMFNSRSFGADAEIRPVFKNNNVFHITNSAIGEGRVIFLDSELSKLGEVGMILVRCEANVTFLLGAGYILNAALFLNNSNEDNYITDEFAYYEIIAIKGAPTVYISINKYPC